MLFIARETAPLLAEKERFELSRRYSRPTPLAGAPLRPLEYFSVYSSQAAGCIGLRLIYYTLFSSVCQPFFEKSFSFLFFQSNSPSHLTSVKNYDIIISVIS